MSSCPFPRNCHQHSRSCQQRILRKLRSRLSRNRVRPQPTALGRGQHIVAIPAVEDIPARASVHHIVGDGAVLAGGTVEHVIPAPPSMRLRTVVGLVFSLITSGFTSANRGPRSSSRKRRPHATTFESPSSTSADVAMGHLLARGYVVRSHPGEWQAGGSSL